MASIRQVAGCLGLSGDISVVHDFFGHSHPPVAIPFNFELLSLLTQVRLLQGPHIHLNLIRVGTAENERFPPEQEEEISLAIVVMRRIYAQISLGIGRIEHYGIPTDQANGRDVIESDAEAEDLTNEWTVSNNGLDVFIVRDGWSESGKRRVGISDIEGSCDKDWAKDLTGCVVSLHNNAIATGDILAHEVAHYLGLCHIDGLELDDIEDFNAYPPEVRNNLMFPRNLAHIPEINAEQEEDMKDHCSVQAGC